MRLSRFLRGVAFAMPLALAACGGSDPSFDLALVVRDCDKPNDMLLPARGTLTVRVTGDGMSPVEVSADSNAGGLDLPEIPLGKNRIATVEVRDRDSAQGGQGQLKALGRSLPFEVKESGSPQVTVILYRVNGFTRTRADGGACKDMVKGRAGHTATLLADGRVLVAGGFSSYAGMEPAGFLSTAEIFDPATGSFEDAGSICEGTDCFEVAFARSALMKDGRVLLVGGVREGDEGPEVSAASAIFDPAKKSWKLGPSLATARRGHTATFVGISGEVVVIGGVGPDGQVVSTVETFNPGTEKFSVVQQTSGALRLPRAFHGAAGFGATNNAIQLAGGIGADGSMETGAPVLSWNNASGYVLGPPGPVVGGVMGAGLAHFRTSNFRLALVGGASKWTPTEGRPGEGVASTISKEVRWFDGHNGADKSGSATMSRERLNPCVAMLGAERALVAGGFGENGNPLGTSEVLAFRITKDAEDKDVLLLQADLPENQGKMREGGRGYATCTDLGDGRVVVIGGISTGSAVVPSAEIYVAQPQ